MQCDADSLLELPDERHFTDMYSYLIRCSLCYAFSLIKFTFLKDAALVLSHSFVYLYVYTT